MAQTAVAFALAEGLDLVTPAVKMPPGRVIAALNYEPTAGGYRRFIGYERFDGRTAPSSSSVPATIATLRTAITAVPGSGPVRGVFYENNTVYAVRDNSGATAGVLHQSSSTGWTAVHFIRTRTYTAGTSQLDFSSGQLAFGATSGATALVLSHTVVSGSTGAGTAAGVLTLAAQSGTFVNENLQVNGQVIAHVAGNSTVQAFAPGGEYKFLSHNFYGAADLTQLFGVNGVDKAFQVDLNYGINFITTGMADDRPVRLAEHRNSLFLAFPGGSVQHSTVGAPTDFDPVTGAGELGIGNNVVDFATPPNSLAILGEKSIHILYGSDSADYVLEELSDASGALPHTAQEVGGVIYMDNRGLRKLSAAQGYGNFRMGTLSALIAPLLEDKRRDSIEPTASLVCRSGDQYWLFFEDGTGFVAYLGGKQPSILPFNLGITVTCATSVEDDGVERLFVGASNGFVYELNKGTSFDGEVIEHYVRLPFNNFGSPGQNKQFHRFRLDIEAAGATSLSASFELNFGSEAGLVEQSFTVTTGGGAIDDLGTNELYYTSQIEAEAELYIDGVARNISAKIGGETSHEQAHTLTAATYYVTPLAMEE